MYSKATASTVCTNCKRSKPTHSVAGKFSAAVGANVASISPTVSTLFDVMADAVILRRCQPIIPFYLNERFMTYERHTPSETKRVMRHLSLPVSRKPGPN
jgi:hypothetical protein